MATHRHSHYWAFVLHRWSGLLLALFLPFHFYVLGLALQGEAALDQFLRWTEQPWLKITEVILVLLLAAHFTGGLRILLLEFMPWRDYQKAILSVAGGVALAFAIAFALALL